ncbi:MAG: FtsX-like permease family protein [Myxococcaceae bacterium]|nr:FtsX-like permease family protein [Myxococcaceae bacterium]
MSRLPSLAVRNVGRNRRRSAITGLAIMVAVILVMVLRGFIDGAGALMTADVVEGRSGALQIHHVGFVDNIEAVPTRLNMPYTPEVLAKIRAVPNVTGVSGRLNFNGLISNGRTQTMFVGRALDLEHEKEACPRTNVSVKEGGHPLEPSDTTAALVGYELGDSFDLKLGQTVSVQVTSPGGRSNALDLSVKGYSTSSFPFENKRVITVPLATAQALIGLEGRVTEYGVGVKDLSRLEETRRALQATLGPDYEVHTWMELNAFVRDVINRQNFMMGAIAAVLFIIALTVIANTMMMTVFERVREIGTLLAVGVRRAQVLALFMLEAAVLGSLAALAGAVIGRTALALIAAKGIPMELPGTSGHSMLEPTVSVRFVVGSVLVACLGAVLASAWPAWRASRQNPVDALRSA